jgi:TolA-binding protein
MRRLLIWSIWVLVPMSAAAQAVPPGLPVPAVMPAPRPIEPIGPIPPDPALRPMVVPAPAPAPMPAPFSTPIPAPMPVIAPGPIPLPALDIESVISAAIAGVQIDPESLREQVEQARQAVEGVQVDSAAIQARIERARDAVERTREEMARQGGSLRSDLDQQREIAMRAREDALRAAEQARAAAGNQSALGDLQARMASEFSRLDQGAVIRARSGEDTGQYNAGLDALQQRQYDRAIMAFDRVIAQKTPRTDGALYWKAFAQFRLAHTEDALASIAQLRREYPQSRYQADARVLEADIRKSAGQPVNLDAAGADEDIKLLAISGIARSDPDRAIPLLQNVLTASNSLAIKRRALYVLALSDDGRAHQILLQYAKGGGNPDLQAEAIRYLSSRQDNKTSSAELKDIYASTQDTAVRRAIIDAYRSANDKASLIAIASSRSDPPELRGSAITSLARLASPQEIWTIYEQEPDAAVRSQIVSVLASMGALDQLSQAARTDKDADVRRRAVFSLASRHDEKTAPMLVEIYSATSDADLRKTVIDALASQGSADALVSIARKESSVDLKREIVRRLSDMAQKNKAASDYLMEMLNK